MWWLSSMLLSAALAQEVDGTPGGDASAAAAELLQAKDALRDAQAAVEQARASEEASREALARAEAEVVFYERVFALWGDHEEAAIRALADTKDPRALTPLAATVERRSPAVAAVAAEVLFRVPGAEARLQEWCVSEGLPIDVRVAAATSLARTGSAGAGPVLVRLAGDRSAPRELRQHADQLVRSYFPAQVSDLPAASDGTPTPWLVGGGAYMLGHDLGMLGVLGRSDLQGLGAVAGGAGGAAGGWVLGRTQDLSAADAAFLSLNGSLGTTAGTMLGASMDGQKAPWVGGFLGQASGLGASLILRKAHNGTPLDSVEAGALGLTAAALSTQVVTQVDENAVDLPGDARWRAMGISLAAGTAVGHVVAPRIDLRPETLRLGVLTTGYGAALGGLLPLPLANRSGEPYHRDGLLQIGAGLGLVGGYVGGHRANINDATTAAGALGFVHGAALGVGAAGLLQLNDRASSAVVLTGITGGLLGGVALGATGTGELKQEDTVLLALVTGWSAYQGAGWLAYTSNHVEDRPPGAESWFLVVPATVSLGGAVATRYVDVPPIYVLSSASLGVWGGYVGGVVAVFADKEVLAPVLVGSDVGLVAGLALGHPRLGASPMVVGLADAGGVLGGSVGALLVSFGSTEPKAIMLGSLVGAAGGFTGGAVLGSRLRDSEVDLRVGKLHLPKIPGQGFFTPTALPTESGVAYGVMVGRVGF